MKKRILIYSFIVFLIDLISKILVSKFIYVGQSITIFTKFLYLTNVHNDGISFSMLQGKKIFIILITLIIFFLLYKYMNKFKNNKRNIIAFALLYGGLFGNLCDRIIYGYVIDFIDVYLLNYNFPIFNLADTFICIGIFLLIFSVYRGDDDANNSK